MDFTQRMLDRSQSRRTKLESINENSSTHHKEMEHNIVTTISSASVQRGKSSANNKVTIETTVSWSKIPPLSPSHPVIEVISDGTTSTDLGSESSDEKENEKPEDHKSCHRNMTKSRSQQQFEAVYSGNPEIINYQITEDQLTSEEPSYDQNIERSKPAGRNARLAALADTINQWEDDPRHFPVGKEAQGFSRSVSNRRLIYNYNEEGQHSPPKKTPSPVKASSPETQPSPVKVPSPVKPPPGRVLSPMEPLSQNVHSPCKQQPARPSPVKARYGSPIQMGTTVLKGTYHKPQVPSSSDEELSAPVMGVKQLRSWCRPQSPVRASSPTKQARDPAELSLAERMALFERNAGQAVLPKPPFNTAVSCSKLQTRASGEHVTATPHKSSQQHSSGSLHNRLAMFEKEADERPYTSRTSPEWKQEIDMLKQRWNKNQTLVTDVTDDLKPSRPPTPPPLPSPPEPFEFGRVQKNDYGSDYEEDIQYSPSMQQVKPEEACPALKEVKKVRFSSPIAGYPNPQLSDKDTDVEAHELSDNNNRSLTSCSSRESDVCSSEQDYVKLSKSTSKRDWSASESVGADPNEINDFLEEALDSSSDEMSPPKRSSYSSNAWNEACKSFHQENSPNRREHNESSNHPLLRTVSFYRKQQNMATKPVTPLRRFEINPNYSEESLDQADNEMNKQLVKEKIERLNQEITKQHMYISQARQALNICYSTFEFSGSTEQLEAEKLLLLASLRKQALIQEIQRLNIESTLYCGESSLSERGSITISHVTVPLRMDVIHQAAKDDECYYLLCLVRRNEEVLCSDIMSTRRSLHGGNKITFPNSFIVKDLYNDFKITVEFYAMKARHKELIPHDIKYHINKNKKEVSKLRLTPRKLKGDPRLMVQSSTNPSASSIRTSAFTLAGYLVFSLREIHRTQFTLSKSRNTYNNVVEGSVQLRLETEMRVDVEYRGFLTMFEDIAGLGAWHRRWCLLKGDKLSYWRYPDDERKKIPMDTIELSQCPSKEVEIVRRDMCARPNTLQLFTVRPARHNDIESLVLTVRGDRTCVRHWLSADTREERDQWCHHLNKALALMRAWGVSTAL